MKAQFNLIDFLKANREYVISQHEACKKEFFYNGVTLSQFMADVLNIMQINNPRSEKRAASLMVDLVGQIVVKHSSSNSIDKRQEALKAKYKGTAYMAMI